MSVARTSHRTCAQAKLRAVHNSPASQPRPDRRVSSSLALVSPASAQYLLATSTFVLLDLVNLVSALLGLDSLEFALLGPVSLDSQGLLANQVNPVRLEYLVSLVSQANLVNLALLVRARRLSYFQARRMLVRCSPGLVKPPQ